jgi:GT2 family glycosyltransferase
MVSIIIVNYNSSRLLIQCVDSIEKHVKGVDYEIIVADNASSEEELVLLRDDKRFTLLELDNNIGFGQANNTAARIAKGDFLFLLNPDTILINDAVSILYKYISSHQSVGICGGNLYDAKMQPTHSYHRLYPSIISEMDFATGQLFRRILYGKNSQFNTTSFPIEVAMITGADLMIRHDIWTQLQGFDSKFFMYCEDADLCFRCNHIGYKNVSIPDAHIQHLEGKSFIESEKRCRRILEGRFIFFHKHYSPLYNRVSNILNIFSLKIAIIIYKIIGTEAIVNYRQRLRIYREFTTNEGN